MSDRLEDMIAGLARARELASATKAASNAAYQADRAACEAVEKAQRNVMSEVERLTTSARATA